MLQQAEQTQVGSENGVRGVILLTQNW